MHLALLTGGTSSEREIALKSAEHLVAWIETTIHTYEIFIFPEDQEKFLSCFQIFDRALPVFHGEYGEDGVIHGFLEVIGIAMTGPRYRDHALCIDKYRTTQLVSSFSIPSLSIPQSWMISDRDEIGENKISGYILKPNTGGSSQGLHQYDSSEEVGAFLDSSDSDGVEWIIQEMIPGREFTIAVYQESNGNIQTLPGVEILQDPSQVFGYEEKYHALAENEIFITDTLLQENISRISISIYQKLRLSGLVRIDFRLRDEIFYFLEINTIPGFTPASLVPKMWLRSGRTKKEYVDFLLS